MFSDFFYVSVTGRIRLIFTFFAIISIGGFITYYGRDSMVLNWEWFYNISFGISAVSCIVMAVHPKIGNGSLHLFPLWSAMVVWVVDVWMNYFFDGRELMTMNQALASSLVPVFVITAISYIDLLESRIYHRLVETLGKETE